MKDALSHEENNKTLTYIEPNDSFYRILIATTIKTKYKINAYYYYEKLRKYR